LTSDHDERAYDDEEGDWRIAKASASRQDGQRNGGSDPEREQ
jgi:hypothetical protein